MANILDGRIYYYFCLLGNDSILATHIVTKQGSSISGTAQEAQVAEQAWADVILDPIESIEVRHNQLRSRSTTTSYYIEPF